MRIVMVCKNEPLSTQDLIVEVQEDTKVYTENDIKLAVDKQYFKGAKVAVDEVIKRLQMEFAKGLVVSGNPFEQVGREVLSEMLIGVIESEKV